MDFREALRLLGYNLLAEDNQQEMAKIYRNFAVYAAVRKKRFDILKELIINE